MGWLRTLFLGDIGNRLDIEDLERELARSRRRARSGQRELRVRLEQLEREKDQIELVVAALSRLLLHKGLCTQAELEELASAIDREDGVEDGRRGVPRS